MHQIRSLASYYRSNLRLFGGHGSRPTNPFATRLPGLPMLDQGRWYSAHQGPHSKQKQETNDEINIEKPSSPPSPPRMHFPSWVRWAFGSILAVILPFWSQQWKTILKIEGEVEMAVEVVEEAADVVEKVATVVERVSSEVAEKMPDDGKLKDAVVFVEHVAKEAAVEAHLTKDIIDKADDLKEEVETLFEPSKIPGKL